MRRRNEYFYSNGANSSAEIVARFSREFSHFADGTSSGLWGWQSHVHDDPSRIVLESRVGVPGDARNGGRSAGRSGGLVVKHRLVTTVRDLLRWERLGTARVGNRALLAAMRADRLCRGRHEPLWLRGSCTRTPRLRTVGHGVGDPGYAA